MPTIIGTSGNDMLNGTELPDEIYGLEGNDTINAGDTSVFNDMVTDDRVHGGAGNDIISAGPGSDVIWDDEGDDTVYAGSGDDNIYGSAGNDYYDGGAGGFIGIDQVTYEAALGGIVVDLSLASGQVRSAGDADAAGIGVDTLVDIEVIGGSQFGDIMTAGAISISFYGGAGNDQLNGGAGADLLDGGAGDDILNGGAGIDAASYRSSSGGVHVSLAIATSQDTGQGLDTLTSIEQLIGSNQDDVLTGNSERNYLFGDLGNDRLSGGGGNDYLNDYSGNDILDGGDGDDFLDLDSSFGFGQLIGGNGADRLYGAVGGSILFSAGTENAASPGVDWTEQVDTGAEQDRIFGQDSNDTLYVGYGDIADGGGGTNTLALSLIGSSSGITLNVADLTSGTPYSLGGGTISHIQSVTQLWGSNFADTLTVAGSMDVYGMGGNDTINGGSGNDMLDGGVGNDLLDGGAGADHLFGGLGDDIFIIDNAGDVASEAAGEGTDLVKSSVAYALGANVENLTLTGAAALNGTGNGFDNVITGNEGANQLLGLAGIDRLVGGAGNDLLDGGVGADKLFGGLGDDIYVVDHGSDIVVEYAGEGVDTVQASVNHTLRDNVENIVLTGIYSIYANGNALDNQMTGNSGANKLYGLGGADTLVGLDGSDTLDGGTGADTMTGGAGNEQYYVDNAGDQTIELANEGIDTVRSTIDVTLAANVENAVLLGTANIGATGNGLNNVMTGNAGDNQFIGGAGVDQLKGLDGNDTLDGGVGSDRLYGGTGDDSYVVDTSGDLIFENAGEGIDTVQSSSTFVLAANVENLELTGSANLNGTGNGEDNLLSGNDGANILYGGLGQDGLNGNGGADVLKGEDGNDSLTGGAARDRFYGGTGADQFIFNDGDFAGLTSSTSDQIHDFSQAEGDIIRLDGVDANAGLAGDQGFSFIGSGAFSHTAGELRYAQISGNTYVQGDTDGDGQADFWIRLDGLHALAVGDFVL
jgi:trimeric autotransporter adhesin